MKTVLITGATDGIGKAIASKLLSEEWSVFIVGRNLKKVRDTIIELIDATGKNSITGVSADLSIMADVEKAAETFKLVHQRLDLIILNANSISNERIITSEGHEKNFAIGFLSRVLLIKLLEPILTITKNSQILSVVGISWQRIDFNDLSISKEFTGWKALTRWQWAASLYIKEFSKRHTILTNIYSPGLVKTKILMDEPQPKRAVIKLANLLIGISTTEAAENIHIVIKKIEQEKITGSFFEWKKNKGKISIKTQDGDERRLNDMINLHLGDYLFSNPI